MDLQEYIKKVYTIAFRLTGDETSAGDVASLAIKRKADAIKDIIDTSILHETAREVFSIFLTEPDKYTGLSTHNHSPIQNQLMALEPLSRTALVWKDIMGYNIGDLEIITNCSKSELYEKLNTARKHLIGAGEFYTECPT
ncbi:MAG TPA: hypothetical protein PLV23_01485 [Sedimentibacter sp.]|jgi:DNA-directed RNA polymerase specialized sigma24 family protein|nr:hypothetical protein [Sedimentibacter sp.]HHY99890.1 hypothetical protein [Tissierellia bacterium]HOK48861.1 hypothetical protein [Sedimentibacter sp.]HOW22281.1 hypothetical protein [Sedimentibacter sp.]HRC80369.1 hypothetical protein [Sedimentibacter sp.]